MRVRTILWLLAAALLTSQFATAATAAGSCIEPLQDPDSRDPARWSDLRGLTYPSPANGVVTFLPVESGTGPANIDFYYIRFTPPPASDMARFFKVMRLNFSRFAAGTSHRFAFGEYAATDKDNDAVGLANAKLWEAAEPLGALMTFNLDTLAPVSAFLTPAKAGFGRPHVNVPVMGTFFIEKAGDVQVVCASATNFVFGTVESKVGGKHPVAGVRGFGIASDPRDGSWIFYMKAVDRDSGDIKNNLPKLFGENTFCLGHKFWILFFTEVKSFLQERGLRVVKASLSNHGPAPWPLVDGSTSTPAACFAS